MAGRFLLQARLVHLFNERQKKRQLRIQNRRLRDLSDPFSMPEINFKNIFRLSPQLVRDLVITLTPFFHAGRKPSAIPVLIKILTALQFYASGSYQRFVGINYNLGLSQASVSRCISEVSEVIYEHLLHQWIKFPQNQNDIQRTKLRFLEQYDFPGVIGCVDGTHVAIVAPPENDVEHPTIAYYNRKGYYSINVQIICNADLKITAINARYPGSTHDSAVWRTSTIRRHLNQQFLNNVQSGWLLGDSGYPLEPWLLTPIINPATNEQTRYVTSHCRTRNCVERTVGVLKSRFRCLLKHRALHYNPVKAGKIIYACAVLHNIAVNRQELIDMDIILEDNLENEYIEEHVDIGIYNNGARRREQLIRNHFTR